jgi:phosphoribosyl 1,2-cyclic phosphodiesterase
MKFTFLGTRGEIEARSRRHWRHSSALIAAGVGRVRMNKGVMVDCGLDWHEIVFDLKPSDIILTHAHPDHAHGLKDGAPCPVWATREAWDALRDYPIQDRYEVHPREPLTISGVTFEAFPVEHSIRCPAVCYRVSEGDARILYAPDVVAIKDRTSAMRGVDVYIGDAATLTHSFVRRVTPRDSGGEEAAAPPALVGHTTVKAQIGWCRAEAVDRAVFTHCGMEVTTAGEGEAEESVRKLGLERGIHATIAFDGMELSVKG